MENLLSENEIFCDLDSIKLDLDSDLFDLSPFEFERAAASATSRGGDDFISTEIKTEPDAAANEPFPLSSLLSPPATPVITANNINSLHQPPSWSAASLAKSPAVSKLSFKDECFTPLEQAPPNKNIVDTHDHAIRQILEGLQSPVSGAPASSSSVSVSNLQLRPTVVVSAIYDDDPSQYAPKLKLEMIQEFSPLDQDSTDHAAIPVASRTLVPEANHKIMLHKPLIAKDQRTGALQLLPESIVEMEGRTIPLGDLLSASGLHKNLICNLDITPSNVAPIAGAANPPTASAPTSKGQFHPSKTSPKRLSPAVSHHNDHSSHGLVHKLLASPIDELLKPSPQQHPRDGFSSSPRSLTGDYTSANPLKLATDFNHSPLGPRRHQWRNPAANMALEKVFPDSFSVAKSSNGEAMKYSSANSLRSVIKNKIIQAKQSKPTPIMAKSGEIVSKEDAVSSSLDSKSRGDKFNRSAMSVPSSPVPCDRASFLESFAKSDLDDIIPEPLDNDCIICGVAFQNQSALRDHLEEHRDHISMIQSGGAAGQAALIDSPPYSSGGSVSDDQNGTSSGCPSTADAGEFYVGASMPASPASSTSSLDQLLMTTTSPGHGHEKKPEPGSTLASLLVSNITPLLSANDNASQLGKGLSSSTLYNARSGPSLSLAQNFLSGNTFGGSSTVVGHEFVANLFKRQNTVPDGAKWKKTGAPGVGMTTLIGEHPNLFGKMEKKIKGVGLEPLKVGQKRKFGMEMLPGIGGSKSCPVSPTYSEINGATAKEGMAVMHASLSAGIGSDLNGGHQGPKTKKCRRVYGLNQKNLWCTQCQWKKACARFKPPKQ